MNADKADGHRKTDFEIHVQKSTGLLIVGLHFLMPKSL